MVHMERIIGFFHGSPSQVGSVRATLSLQQKGFEIVRKNEQKPRYSKSLSSSRVS